MRLLTASMLLLLATSTVVPTQAQITPPKSSPSTGYVDLMAPSGQMGVESEAPRWHHRVLTAVAGAALGAGIGYFGSQLSRGDWDDGPGQPQVNRPAWAMVGGSVGFAAGYSFPVFGKAPPPGREFPTSSRMVITAQEIEDAVAVDAYDAVRVLRPEWLIPRNTDILGRFPQATLPVYLDDFRLGDADDLRGLAADRIESIRFISAAAAIARWGVGNNYGVIQVVTRGGSGF